MRKWPSVQVLDRKCTRDYTLNTTDGRCIELKEGDCVFIPLVAIHHDPDLFPEPDRFDPERFNDERRQTIKPFSFLALGAGPRNCIGSRFVLIKVKVFLFHLLTTFTLERAVTSQVPVELSGGGWMKTVKVTKGIDIHLRPRVRA